MGSAYRPPSGTAIPNQVSSKGVPLFGAKGAHWSVVKLALDNAQTPSQLYALAGTFLWAIAASDQSAVINVRFNRQDSDPLPFNLGMNLNFPFGGLYIDWPAQPGKYLTLCATFATENVSVGNAASVLATLFNNIVVNVTTSGLVGSFKSYADVALVANAAAVQLLAPNPNRKFAEITNESQVNSVRVGDSAISNTQGIYLYPGSAQEIATTAGVYGYSFAGATVSIHEV